MHKLEVQLLHPLAKSPTIVNPGEDLGYDLYSLEDVILGPFPLKVRTGVAVSAKGNRQGYGLLIRDRSSMASKGIFTHGGVIDAGYTGEIQVLMTCVSEDYCFIKAGDKIAQMVPVPVLTGDVEIVELLKPGLRGEAGFGSSGR